MVLEQLDIHLQNMNLDTDLIPFTKINSEWIIGLYLKWKTIKLLEDNREENLDDLGFGSDFLNTTPNAQSMKEIIDKLDVIKIKNFWSAKDTEENEKTSHRLGENICKKSI